MLLIIITDDKWFFSILVYHTFTPLTSISEMGDAVAAGVRVIAMPTAAAAVANFFFISLSLYLLLRGDRADCL